MVPDDDDEPTGARPRAPTGDGDEAPHQRSGSVDVAFSGAALPLAKLPDDDAGQGRHQTSGSVDVDVGDGSAVPRVEHGASRSIRMRAATGRLGRAATDGVGKGVGKVGEGFTTLGGGLSRLGERVERLPAGRALGAGVRDLGAGVADLGESLTTLPVIAKTQRGRALVRGLFVGLTLVATWIAVIVYVQLRAGQRPDLRPVAEQVLLEVRGGDWAQLYEATSPRFKEVMVEDQFADVMNDLTATVGAFVEIAAVNDTVVTRGPSGKVARVDLLLVFERGKAKSNLSLHWDEGRWKLMGISVDLPAELIAVETSEEARASRVRDPAVVSAVVDAARQVISRLATGDSAGVWADAAPVFQATVSAAAFAEVEADRAAVVGKVVQYLDTTRAYSNPGKTAATVVALVEYARSSAVTTRFGFERTGAQGPWRLTSYKVVLPMPLAGP